VIGERPLFIQVRLYGVFRNAAGTGSVRVEVEEGNGAPTVRSVIEKLTSEERHAGLKQLIMDAETSDPRPNALIMVSGREISSLNGLETELSADSEIVLLPVAHGG